MPTTLSSYQASVLNLLQAPSSPTPLVSTAQLTIYVNTARGQVAGEAKCIVPSGAQVALVAGTQEYAFSSVTIADSATIGIGGINDVEQASFLVGEGQKILVSRPIEWFITYYMGQPVPETGPPRVWCQRGQGQIGSLLFFPVPDIDYVCPLEVDAYPVPLIDDTTPEAIPQLWQDAVPFYAAWLAFMQLQRSPDAEAMMKRYQELMRRARQAATPDVLPENFEQTPDLTMPNKLGLSQRGGAAAGG